MSKRNENLCKVKKFDKTIDGIKVVQLTSTKEVYTEGSIMRHCVSSYVNQAKSQQCYLFHYGDAAPNGATIQIDSKASLVQAYGYFNSYLTSKEVSSIKEWTKTIIL